MKLQIMETLDVKSIDNKMDMANEHKSKEQNRICQLAFKARQKMPKDYRSFCMVASHMHISTTHHRHQMNWELKSVKMA